MQAEDLTSASQAQATSVFQPQRVTFEGRVDLLGLHQRQPQRYPFLLQSAVNGAPRPATAAYDLLFAFPAESYSLWPGDRLYREQTFIGPGDFLHLLDQVWREARTDIHSAAIQSGGESDLPFSGGWFVYLGYELAAQIEPRLTLPEQPDQAVASLTRIPAALIYDHQQARTILVAEPGSESLLEQIRQDIAALQQQALPSPAPVLATLQEDPPQQYLDSVARVKRYIVEGDVFQVNLSRGWQAQFDARQPPPDAAQLYRQLCRANPAPFAGLARFPRFPQFSIISSSPERLVQTRQGRVQTRPIAGTRPRLGAGDNEDAEMLAELIGHPKERAEHIMLIDLERNDLGRVCEPGSIEVNELMSLESYAHVHHIVSNVRGRLRDGITPGEVLRAVFPGGTITGCPKERCMAIIAELEQTPRGAYTGSMGYLNHNGDMDLNILIRSITLRGHDLQLRAGAGLVADSDPQLELQETRHKARGLLRALADET